MNPLFWLLILAATFILAAFLFSLVYAFGGIWERMDDLSKTATRERIKLAQFGFIVIGSRIVVGGQQSFFGFAFANTLWLRRRDKGMAFLTHEGFPEGVAKQVEGQVMARYRLHLSKDRQFINGVFIPYRVEFSADPPRVTAMHPQAPLPRKYRRLDLVVEKEVIAASTTAE